jgi:hypothetical protein
MTSMTKIEKWFLKRIAKKVVIQGNHKNEIIKFYGFLIKTARNEFTEDNKYSLDSFLKECHLEALNK